MCYLLKIKMKIIRVMAIHLRQATRLCLEILVVTMGVLFMALGGFLGSIIFFHILLNPVFWIMSLSYLSWVWIYDKHSCARGGRRVEWMRGLGCWRYLKQYFPIQLEKDSDLELDPQKNYLFCSFPHGILATGVFSAFGTTAGGFHEIFPNHKPHILTLKQNFVMPLLRDFLLAMGLCSVSVRSLNWLMGHPGGGNVAVLVVGGAAESLHCRPGQYRLVLKNRKGFVKIAIKNGSPLVPVFSFGETDIYSQICNPKGSLLRCIQEKVKDWTGVAPIIPLGRGIFLKTFGIMPMKKPINIIIGKPIEVDKTETPSDEQIDALHKTFITKLTALFEKHKHKYLKYPEKTSLIIE